MTYTKKTRNGFVSLVLLLLLLQYLFLVLQYFYSFLRAIFVQRKEIMGLFFITRAIIITSDLTEVINQQCSKKE